MNRRGPLDIPLILGLALLAWAMFAGLVAFAWFLLGEAA